MITRKKVVVTKEYNEVVSTTCDICKKTFPGMEWPREPYSILETNVSMKIGTSYPECGDGVETIFDICPDCFVTKLIPALRALGAEPREREWSW